MTSIWSATNFAKEPRRDPTDILINEESTFPTRHTFMTPTVFPFSEHTYIFWHNIKFREKTHTKSAISSLGMYQPNKKCYASQRGKKWDYEKQNQKKGDSSIREGIQTLDAITRQGIGSQNVYVCTSLGMFVTSFFYNETQCNEAWKPRGLSVVIWRRVCTDRQTWYRNLICKTSC